ncbi:hypothetical protein KFE25_005990 [Diacronema lutheri]|uniref:Uncharacterized protein n=1 Tax=Diacronema lutheri TaxID=2081491 RepID=A0A8J6CGV7_DIALT|nr:hypothetical protein KFE25_005990 [Diacronema lutheri]|mmetsp:Transcript_16049/g.49996  ORF Transcript_16049/g.49996 Transcript_16049/m.49996 type:complete len:378 (+) Transcript_16049:41-1174(+)
MSWCAAALVATRLGRCLAICVPEGSELLTGRLSVCLGPLCRLLASMLALEPKSTAERRVRLGGLVVLVRAREQFYVAIVLTRIEHVQSAGVLAIQLASAVDTRASHAVRLAAAAAEEDAASALGSYTATSALNGAADAASIELRTLEPFAGLEMDVLRPLLTARPCAERLLTPLLSHPAVLGSCLLEMPDESTPTSTHAAGAPLRLLVEALTRDPLRAPLVELIRLTDASVWSALAAVCAESASRAAGQAPLALPGLARGHPHAAEGVARVRALVGVGNLGHGARALLVLFYAAQSEVPSTTRARSAVDTRRRVPARAWWRVLSSWRVRVQPRPIGQAELVCSSGGALACVLPLKGEAVPAGLTEVFAALCHPGAAA